MSFKCKIPEGVSGDWRIERFVVPKQSIMGWRHRMEGRPVKPGIYTRLILGSSYGGTTVMSDTPAELDDLWPFLNRVETLQPRTILINGLGLGIAVQLACRQKSIERITVLENSEDVCALVCDHVQKDSRVHVHLVDCLSESAKKICKGVRLDLVWHDIWNNIPNEDNLTDIHKLKRRYANRCRWQGVWCEDKIRR